MDIKHNLFGELVEKLKLQNTWPRTAKGKFATDSKTIEKFRMVPQIEKLTKLLKHGSPLTLSRTQQKRVNTLGATVIFVRTLVRLAHRPGRNAAKATSFPPAMANWCRALMRPPKGKTIIGIDYSSQEFAIGASLSGDKNMIEAYHLRYHSKLLNRFTVRRKLTFSGSWPSVL